MGIWPPDSFTRRSEPWLQAWLQARQIPMGRRQTDTRTKNLSDGKRLIPRPKMPGKSLAIPTGVNPSFQIENEKMAAAMATLKVHLSP